MSALKPIKIVTQNIYNLDSNIPTNWLLANVGDLIRIETVFEVANEVIASTDELFICNNKNGYIDSGWITDDSFRFANFKVGDTIYYYNYITSVPVGSGTYTIIDKLSDGEIKLSPPPPIADNTEDSQGVISNTTPITSIKYSYNFIENSGANTFTSKVDGSEQTFAIDVKPASDMAVSNLVPYGLNTWREKAPKVTIQGMGIETSPVYKSTYKIIHYTQVTHLILYEQLQNELDGIKPNDFDGTKCWKLITQIQAAEVYTNPNFLISEVFSYQLGNSGWYNENFNGQNPKMSIAGVFYKNKGVPAKSIAFDDSVTSIDFYIKPGTVPFTNGQVVRIGFFKVPSDPSEYKNNGDYLDYNFCIDGVKVIVGNPAQVGYVTAISDFAHASISSAIAFINVDGSIKVSMEIKMGSAVLDKFAKSQTPRFFIFAALKNKIYSTTDPQNDQVTLKVAMDEFYHDTTDKGMIVIDNNTLLQHPDSDPLTQGISTTSFSPPFINSTAYVAFKFNGTGVMIARIYRLPGDPRYGGILGIANWQGSATLTAAKLVVSINSKIPYGTFYHVYTGIDNPEGVTAVYSDLGGGNFSITLTSPDGMGGAFNGQSVVIDQQDGNTAYFGNFAGGTNGVKKQLIAFPEDEIVSFTNFYIDSFGRDKDVIKITSIESKVIASEGSNKFDLEKFTVQLDSVPLTGYTQQFDLKVNRSFHVPESEIRKQVKIKRRNDLDTGSRKYFSIQYPFMFRWEYWEALAGVNPFFFDSTKMNNGFNHFWHHYQTGRWEIQQQTIVNATKNGVPQQYEYSTTIKSIDYKGNPNVIVKDIKTYDPDTLDQLIIGGQEFIYETKKTLVVATFEFIVPVDEVTVEIGMHVFEQGNISTKRSYSSRWEREPDTYFTSINNDGLVDIQIAGNVVTAKCLIDYTQLPQNIESHSLTARIYEYSTNATRYLLTDDGDPIIRDTAAGENITLD